MSRTLDADGAEASGAAAEKPELGGWTAKKRVCSTLSPLAAGEVGEQWSGSGVVPGSQQRVWRAPSAAPLRVALRSRGAAGTLCEGETVESV